MEFKSPNYDQYNEKSVRKNGRVCHYEIRMINLTEKEKRENMTSTDSKVKDFLVDAKKNWYKNSECKVITFDNIDLIFISDFYQNILAHMLSGDNSLPGLLTGIPYFESNERFIFPINNLNPFVLPFSRNVLIKSDKEIDESDIFNLPIAFSEFSRLSKYVSKNCSEFRFTYL
ncbi:hypothetical protein [Clostridium tagluense]|uniref:hypothetical protein n=1 Tax=Clostridium tagluense TaxID=360422 RepID=UPI001CF5370A|nr:hypothetical protein [Clostridium tagluense]MCB2297942.1 hypothetical protein [Clostridium tagluense]